VAIPIQPDRDASLAAAHRAIELAVAVGATVIGGGVAVEPGIRLDADVRTAFGACAAVVADAGLRLARNRRLVPGAGNLDLPRFVEFLRTRSDVDFVALEVLSASVRSSPPVPFARAALRAFDRLWS
jgi:sugar phosphate isomerase/epimerase